MAAYYQASIKEFLNSDQNAIVGQLNLGGTEFVQQYTRSTTSWNNSIEILKKTCIELIAVDSTASNWHILFEYELPRIPWRIDAVILANDLIFVIEFKDEREIYQSADVEQSLKYAYALHNFHLESNDRVIIPILLAPNAPTKSSSIKLNSQVTYKTCLKANANNLSKIVYQAFTDYHNNNCQKIKPLIWEKSDYQPTLTIIEAAKALFADQKVEAITRSGADDDDLRNTTNYLIEKISAARNENKKIICFVTGVPGAGKTLVGLNLVHETSQFGDHNSNTAYFSGNTPLVNVLREALSRDNYGKEIEKYKLDKTNLTRPKKANSEIIFLSKIQNLHLFVKEFILGKVKPHERIVVFDEAQRCWDAKHFNNKSKQNQNREKEQFISPNKSEAEMIIEFMNGHDGWAVIVALVGPGQEINTGEAGISEWGNAIINKFRKWEVHTSKELTDVNSKLVSKPLFDEEQDLSELIIHKDDRLFLKVNQRSFKAKDLISWVDLLLTNQPEKARELSIALKEHFPLFITREINTAKKILKEKMAPGQRIGLIASSQGLRLRPYGVIARDADFDECSWFLNDEDDIRSSNFLETVATEYKVQGLELDWAGICWDADLRRTKSNSIFETDWDYKTFSGKSWSKKEKSKEELMFIKNTYRVLLTRSREGIVIFVPKGDEEDRTRLPEFYDPIFEYLVSCGMDDMSEYN
jgi:hypothetical protein